VIDSHTHLGLCEPADEELVAQASLVGVTRMLNVGTDVASSRDALAAAERFPSVFAAVGCHPNSATGFDDATLAELRELAGHERCAAIGETGLDYFRDYAAPDDQRRAFAAQIELARELDLPLIIHTRSADDETLATLRERAGDVRVILHCFSMAGRIAECIAAGHWISFAGNVTYPKSDALAEAATHVPAERLLVETDAPYLTPVPRRGKPNTPADVIETARFVAERRGVPYDELERGLERCAAELFGW
jgi:TatD DNase family protein